MKLKQTLAVLAALGIIALGALLPELTARRQDLQDMDVVLFTQVEGVELEFTQYDMTRSETLAILGHSRDAVEIPPELANLSQEKVAQIAEATVRSYQEAGILLSDPGKDSLLHALPLLYYGVNGQSNVFWILTYGDGETSHLFTLTVDDRTGTVCSMEYVDGRGEYDPDRMKGVLQTFCQFHLMGLGDGSFDWSAEELVENAQAPQDYSYLATELQWEDPTYGKTRITFFVNRTGFYTYFDRAA